MDSGSSNSDTSSSDEDEYDPKENEAFERDFYKTLSCLKNKDPSIYDESAEFFQHSPILSSKKRKKNESVNLSKYEHNRLFNGNYDGGEKLDYVKGSVAEEENKLKSDFKKLLNDSDSDDCIGEFRSRNVKKEDEEKEEADYVLWLKGKEKELNDKETENSLKPLKNYWNSDKLDKGEEFLKDYLLNKRYLDKYSDEDDDDDDKESEASSLYDDQEEFEHNYNMRFENESGDLIRRFPRNIEGSLRKKDDRRKRKRLETKKRKEKELKKKREEINRLKNIKAQEIKERLEKLKELTGNEKLAFNDDDIAGDFNPEEYDEKMSAIYNDEFYSKEDSIKPNTEDFENDMWDYGNEMSEGPSLREKKKTRTMKKKERKKKAFKDILSIEKPTFNPQKHSSFDHYMDEYYNLDCEDFIDDLPCRFKYRQVEPNDFGLKIEEILAADDKELNQWSSMKKVYKLRKDHVERNEANIYKKKSQDENLKRKLLPSLFKDDESLKEMEQEELSAAGTSDQKKSKKRKFKKKPVVKGQEFHESRLVAYGLNPKKFKSR